MVLSRPLANTMGAFQGSVLGPLLFIIFAKDLSLHAEGAAVFQYADDSQVLVSGPKDNLKGLTSRMKRSLESLSRWFYSHTPTKPNLPSLEVVRRSEPTLSSGCKSDILRCSPSTTSGGQKPGCRPGAAPRLFASGGKISYFYRSLRAR